MEVFLGEYGLLFENGGVCIEKCDKELYYNKRPIYAFIKTSMAVTEFFDTAYSEIKTDADSVFCCGVLTTPNGSELEFQDRYEVKDNGVVISREIKILKKAKDDLGFASKISFVLKDADKVRDLHCFAPANWYRDNEYARPYVIGYDPDCEYHLRKETAMTLPLFAAQTKSGGETIMFSRNRSDVKLPGRRVYHFTQVIDEECNVGSIGLSKPENKTLNYLYYGFPVRKETGAVSDGLSIDYVYPATDG